MNEHLHTMAVAARIEAIARMFMDMATVIHEQAEEAGYTLGDELAIDEPPIDDEDTRPAVIKRWEK